MIIEKFLGLVGILFVLIRSLEVRQLREFNLSLLGKWCWRMLVDRGGFWYRVLASRYGEEAGRLGAGVVLFGGGRWLRSGMEWVMRVLGGFRRWCLVRWEMGLTPSLGLIGG